MKYKYVGQNDTFCLELLAFGIMEKNEYLQNGMEIEVPETNTTLVKSLDANGLFKRVNVTVNKAKKEEVKKND